MPYIFPVYPLGQDTPGAPIINGATQLYPYTPAPEPGYAHWLLGGDGSSLVPYGGDATLTAQGVSHTWGSNYVNLPSYQNALISSVADATVQTFYAAVRYAPVSGKNVIVVGNISLASQGAGIWIDGNGNVCTILRNSSGTVLVNHGVPANTAVRDWIFLGLSKRVEAGVSKTLTSVGSVVYEVVWPAVQAVSGSNHIAIGNPLNSSSTYTPADLRVGELLIKPNLADSAAQMMSVYSHSRARLAPRGIMLK